MTLPLAVLVSVVVRAPPPAAPAPAPLPDVPRLLARLAAGDPPVDEVQRAAAQRAAPSPEEAAGWKGRARWAAWLPRLSTWYRHDENSSRTLGLTSSSAVDYVRLAPADEVGVRLSWNLAEVVHSDAEVRTAEAAARAARLRAEAAERATRLYFRRRELLAALWLDPPAEPRARAAAELAVDEATAELDFLTGGLFGGRR
jgi:hypothetical protein